MVTLNKIFDLDYGDREYIDKSLLDEGKTLLIASQGVDNGAFGFFDIPAKHSPPLITVPRTGSIGYAFVQLTPCTITDDCIVLKSKNKVSLEYLYYIASLIRLKRWRFNYARKITPERLATLEIISPDDFKTKINFSELNKRLNPKRLPVSPISYKTEKKEFLLSDLFDIVTGDYHSINDLKEGKIPLISCSEFDNGISGFYNIPLDKTYKNMITVTYDGRPLTAKFHDYHFAAYDNVGILLPKKKYRKETLLFVALLLNIERWRYSYGRKCYNQKIKKLKLKLPVKENNLNEEYISQILQKRDILGLLKER
ncbi:restriction endonuclease subunit S [Candidatus Woesearchaeota archaeon]|nr:restriction endonuclease subunit S [Candidatus Woesearchaeota archaeon]